MSLVADHIPEIYTTAGSRIPRRMFEHIPVSVIARKQTGHAIPRGRLSLKMPTSRPAERGHQVPADVPY